MDLLRKVYDPEAFREEGYQLVDQLADVIQSSLNKNIQVNKYQNPDERLKAWSELMKRGNHKEFQETLIEESIHLHHPHFIGHQISPPAPMAALGGLVADVLNNGMGVYEMGGPATALEKWVVQEVASYMGFGKGSDGFLTAGGTLANLTALLTARHCQVEKNIWKEGNQGVRLGIMVSEQAHYCVDRAARIMGLGEEGIIKIPVRDNYSMDKEGLEGCYKKAVENGITPFTIIGSACSTATGSYDDLIAIADFASAKNLWFHVDGAHGAPVIFSEKYKHLVSGIDRADSVIMDFHKMMMIPALATAVIYKNGDNSYRTFSQRADYLFAKKEQEWFNLAKRTFECTKFMMSVKIASLVIHSGWNSVGHFVTKLYDSARLLARKIDLHPDFELAHQPQANIVCFMYTDQGLKKEELNDLNLKIRQKLLEEGDFYIVQTVLAETFYLRCTVMNPFTTESDFDDLLSRLSRLAKSQNKINQPGL